MSEKSKDIKKKDKYGGSRSRKEEGVVNFDSESEAAAAESSSDDDDSVKHKKKAKALPNFYKEKKRAFTISIVVPSSIIDNA